MLGMPRCGGPRRGGVGMRWIRCVILGSLGPALMPWCSLVRAPPFDALAPRLLWASALARPQGLSPPRQQATPLSSLASRQPGESAGGLEDLAPESESFFPPLAVWTSTAPGPKKTCRPRQEDQGPSWRRVRCTLLVDSRVSCLSFKKLWQPLRRQGTQAQGFLTPLRRSGQRERRVLLPP